MAVEFRPGAGLTKVIDAQGDQPRAKGAAQPDERMGSPILQGDDSGRAVRREE
jgi:hypothetical protein